MTEDKTVPHTTAPNDTRQCFECGDPAEHDHHVVPQSLGGTKTVPLCLECHAIVHDLRMLHTPALTKAALSAKKARGEKTGGDAPIGFDVAEDGRTIVPNPLEQAAINRIRRAHADGLSMREIVARLNAEGVPCRGSRWHLTTVARLLRSTNTAEAGESDTMSDTDTQTAALADVREGSDILSVIGDRMVLHDMGTHYEGLCPFHNEVTPSFHVHPDRGFFYCFGCQTGGDVITFVREINGCSFHDAVRYLAERAGIQVPDGAVASASPTATRAERDSLYAVNKTAWRFYVEALNSAEGTHCREYLKSEGIDQTTIERFGLGYAPDHWDALAQRVMPEGPDLTAAAETVGLISQRQAGEGYYDRFRHQLMFPIRNLAGEVIGFSGLGLGDIPKYATSIESSIYQKAHSVYGLYEAREAIRKKGQAIVVHDLLQVVKASQNGVEETVAPAHGPYTTAQSDLIERFGLAIYLG